MSQGRRWAWILEVWLPAVLRIANSPQVTAKGFDFDDTRGRLRMALQDVIDGGNGGLGLLAWDLSTRLQGEATTPELDDVECWLPREGVRITTCQIEEPKSGPSGLIMEPVTPPRYWRGIVPDIQRPDEHPSEATLHAVVMALANDPQHRRLRRCDWEECGQFFFARRDHRRDHHFCCEDHRRAFDVAHRDPKQVAAYMRKHRRIKKQMREHARHALAKRKAKGKGKRS